jgi:hypothetical protein
MSDPNRHVFGEAQPAPSIDANAARMQRYHERRNELVREQQVARAALLVKHAAELEALARHYTEQHLLNQMAAGFRR